MLSFTHFKAKIIFALITLFCLPQLQTVSHHLSLIAKTQPITMQKDGPYSEQFYKYENKLLNEKVEAISFGDDINKNFEGFDKDYLLGLLKKRNKKFEDAFELLYRHLDSNPEMFRYYDELVDLARITGRLSDLLEKSTEDLIEDTYAKYFHGDVELELNNYKNANRVFNDLIDSGVKSVELYYKIANTYRGLGDYQKGINQLKQAEAIIDSNNILLPKILNAKGSFFYLSGNYTEAKKNYNSAKTFAERIGNTKEKIKSVINLSIIKDTYGDVYNARNDLIRVVPLAESIQDYSLIALIHSELGVNYTYTNEIVDARKNYERSYSFYNILKDSERLSYLSSNIASIFLQINNYRSALKYYQQGLALAGENILGKILNLTGIADVYSNMSNYSKAIEYYKQAGELADSVQDVLSQIKIDEGFGALYFNINKPNTALSLLQKAERRIEIEEHPFEAAEIFHKIGTVLSSMDSLEHAIDYLSRGLSISKNSGDLYYEMILMTELAFTYYKIGNRSKAINLLTDALDLSSEYDQVQLMCLQHLYFGKIYFNSKKFENALKQFEKSVELAIEAADYNTQIESSYYIAQIFESKSDMPNAEKWYSKALNLIENLSAPLISNQEIQISHFSGFNKIYNDLAEMYLENGDYKKAFEIIDRSRSRNTFLNLNKLLISSTVEDDSTLNSLLDTEWMVSSGLYDGEKLDSLKSKLDKLKSDVKQENSSLISYQNLNHWQSFNEIQKELDKDEVIISLITTEESIWLFTLRSDNFSSNKINVGSDSLIALLSEVAPIYKSDLASEEIYINQDLFSFNAEASWNLYNIIFKDELQKIKRGSTVVFSFPNELLLLPAEFLVTEWNENYSPFYYNDKHFLIEDYNMMYSPSASIHITQKQRVNSSDRKNLLLGDPFIETDDVRMSYRSALLEDNNISTRRITLFPLEYSRQEIENVDKLISENTILLSEEATEENFRNYAPESSIIHLSTHSFLYKNQPLIIVSQEENSDDDGFLEISEILNLDLKCNLVVLSSCRSGLGKIDEAEGILGMQKAFFDAGAGSIIVSIWDVNDKYTSFFMEEFYDALGKSLTKPAALRQAKLNFIKKYSANPYYWSAFVLSGNPSKIDSTTPTSSKNILLYVFAVILIFAVISFFLSRKRFTN